MRHINCEVAGLFNDLLNMPDYVALVIENWRIIDFKGFVKER
jgi:hypothetical protein